jgi:hypothetical protein
VGISHRIAKTIRVFTVLLVSIVVLAACGAGASTKEPSAAALLPNMPGYTVTDTVDIQETVAKVLAAGTLGAGQPELTALVAAVNSLADCYQRAGAIQGRTYVSNTNIMNSGVVVIVNRNAITDPTLLLNCALPAGGAGLAPSLVKPCAKTYTLDKDNNQFYIAYAATNQEVCTAFCSGLEGCKP